MSYITAFYKKPKFLFIIITIVELDLIWCLENQLFSGGHVITRVASDYVRGFYQGKHCDNSEVFSLR